MSPVVVVKSDPSVEALAQGRSAIKRVQVKVLILDSPPESFDKDVVLAAPPTIHADGDLVVLEGLDKAVAGKLRSLVGVENRWSAITAQGLLEGLDTKVRLKGIGNPPGQDFAAVPVHNGHKVHKPSFHWDVGDVGGPDLVGPFYDQIPQQIWVDFVLRMGPTGSRLGVYGLDAHQPHQPLDTFSIGTNPLSIELTDHRSAAPAWVL